MSRYSWIAIVLLGIANAVEAETPQTDALGDPLPSGAIMRLGTVRWRATNNVIRVQFLDAKTALTVSMDHVVQVWDLGTGKELRRVDCSQARPSSSFAPTIFMAPQWSSSSALSGDHKRLVVPDYDGIIRLWDLETGKVIKECGKINRYGTQMHLTHDGKVLAIKGDDQTWAIWDTTNNDPPRRIGNSVQNNRPGFYAARGEFTEDLKTLTQIGWDVVERNGGIGAKPTTTVEVWDVANGKLIRQLTELPRVEGSAGLSPDHRTLALAVKDAIVFLSLEDGKEVGWTAPTGEQSYRTVAFMSDGKSLIDTNGPTSPVRIWEVPSGKLIRKLDPALPGIPRWVFPNFRFVNDAISPDGKALLWAEGPTLSLIDLENGKLRSESSGLPFALREAYFTVKGNEIWGRFDHHDYRRYDAATDREVG
ncbi:MAG TPA: WD40 repeat domain-containing protein, partial [Gemmataceae bacterium]|nr:WD40 repeat domain-containing protein [Gemmataceae bacterium]